MECWIGSLSINAGFPSKACMLNYWRVSSKIGFGMDHKLFVDLSRWKIIIDPDLFFLKGNVGMLSIFFVRISSLQLLKNIVQWDDGGVYVQFFWLGERLQRLPKKVRLSTRWCPTSEQTDSNTRLLLIHPHSIDRFFSSLSSITWAVFKTLVAWWW